MANFPGLSAISVAVLLAAGASNAVAQDAAAPPPVVDIYTDNDAQAVLDARLIALKTVIGLSPDQEKLWTPVDAAIRQAAKNAMTRRIDREKATPAMDFLDVLERIGDAEASRAQDLKSVVAAARPLVKALTEEQRRRIPAFLGMTDKLGAPQPTAELWIFEDEQN